MAAMRVVSLEEATGLVVPLPVRVEQADWPAEIKHLSASSVSKFLTCPEQFRQKYILHQRETPAYYLFQGSVNHRAVDWGLKQKMETGRLPEVKEVLARFDHEWDVEMEERGGVSEIRWDGTSPAEVKAHTALMVKSYMPIAQILDPIALEEWFEVDVPLVPVPLVGRTDIELADRLIDRKTSKSRVREPKMDWIIQGGFYSVVKSKPIDFHVTTKAVTPMTFTPGVDPGLVLPAWSTKRMNTYVQRIARGISMMYREYGPDDVWPGGTTHTYACNLCGFRPTCQWWAE